MAEYDTSGEMYGQPPKLKGFKGEQAHYRGHPGGLGGETEPRFTCWAEKAGRN